MAGKHKSKNVYPRVSRKQLQFLEYLIWKSKNADKFTKQCLIWLMRNSDGLSREVRVTLPTRLDKIVNKGFHDMGSSNGTTHVDVLFALAGSDMFVNYGVPAIRVSFEHPIKSIPVLKLDLDEICAIVPADPYKF